MSDQLMLFAQGMDTAHAGASILRKELMQWNPLVEPADAEVLPELGTLVARSRDLGRNHGIAASAFQVLVDNILGTGLRLAASPDYKALGKDIVWAGEWARNVESLWTPYANSMYFDAACKSNFNEMSELVLRSTFISGEIFVLPLWLERPGQKFATTFQLVEGDRISNPNYTSDTNNLRGGIEVDDYGKPEAYWIRKTTNDYDWMIPGGYYFAPGGTWERVPAETASLRKRVLHIYKPERSGQSRGKPIITSVMEQFKMFDHYQRSELQSAIVNALVAGFIKTPMDQAAIADLMGGDPAGYLARKNEWKTNLKGGAIIPLFPGDELEPFTPSRPAGQYPDYVTTVLRHIGAGLSLPYELLVKDFSKTNYSSARASLLEAWRYFASRRKWISEIWATQVYQLWLEEAVNKGLVEAPGFYESFPYYAKCKWIGAGRGWVDPVKEVQAAVLRVQAGFSTLEMECAEQGYDWVDVSMQRAREQMLLDELGILPMTIATQQQAPDKPKPKGEGAGAGTGGNLMQQGQEGTKEGEEYGE